MKIPIIGGDLSPFYIMMAIGGAAVAAIAIYATNPNKNIPRKNVTPQWPLWYSEVNPVYDVNNVNAWYNAKGRDPYLVTPVPRPQVDYGDDILGSDYDMYGGVTI